MRFPTSLTALVAAFAFAGSAATALTCGNDSSGFAAWKRDFAPVAAANGVGDRGLQALANASYSQRTINADRNQRGVRYELNEFVRIRLGSLDNAAALMRRQYQRNQAVYDAIEARYGVPKSILLAIHLMETGFGQAALNEQVVSSILTVAYDCRRSDFFIPHAIAALILVDRGMNPAEPSAAHGELSDMQFLPGNFLAYGQDGNGDGQISPRSTADALASAAYFLRQKGWQPGQSYGEGTANFRVLNDWNAATVYQQAIALAAARFDG